MRRGRRGVRGAHGEGWRLFCFGSGRCHLLVWFVIRKVLGFLSRRKLENEAAVAAEEEAKNHRWGPERFYSLHVEVVEATELLAADRNGLSDPFAIVDLVSMDTGESIKTEIFEADSTGFMASKGMKRLTYKTKTL